MSERIRVLVVDDSALMRKLIPRILAGDPNIEVIGTAMDGAFALKKIADLKPDVVTLEAGPRLIPGASSASRNKFRFAGNGSSRILAASMTVLSVVSSVCTCAASAMTCTASGWMCRSISPMPPLPHSLA